jgi:drug/metabolite transporter (DMT)-like permease
MSEAGLVATALASALAAATSSVLQHRSARQAPHDGTHRLLGHLVTRPAWILGLFAAGVGLVLHALALAHGQLVIVQPLLISGVLFALPVSALLEGRRPSAREWLWALILVGGLAAFLFAARPGRGQVSLDADVLAWASGIGMVVVGLLSLVGIRWPRGHAAVLLGTAAGVGYGVVAALLKETTTIAQSGIGHIVTDWPVYALIASGAVALVLTQLAYRAGPLARSMPALTITDPAASVALGALAFQEGLANDPMSVLSQIAGFALMAIAAAQLARRDKLGTGAAPLAIPPPI